MLLKIQMEQLYKVLWTKQLRKLILRVLFLVQIILSLLHIQEVIVELEVAEFFRIYRLNPY